MLIPETEQRKRKKKRNENANSSFVTPRNQGGQPQRNVPIKKKKNTLMETKKRGDGIRKRNPKMKRTKKVKV